MADSSITTSLALLERTARERAEQRERAQRRAANKQRVDELVQQRDRRRVDRAREQARKERLRHERLEAQREAARRAGIVEGEKVRAAIAARHDAEMSLMAMRHRRELASMERPRPAASRRPLWLALAAGFALAASALVGGPPHTSHATSWIGATAADRAEIATLTAERSSLERDNELLTDRLALASTSAPSATVPEPAVSKPPPARWSAPRPKAPAPSPAATCVDGIGDPCCAFGQIVC
ncbi:MAG: hypothetical protein RIF41_06080 [Polyangiaceae bacterium]